MPQPPKDAERKQYGLRLSIPLMREVQHLGVDEDRNVNDLVEEALLDFLRKFKKKGGKG